MEKFRYKQEQEILQNLLRQTRTDAGLLQQEVAAQLKKPQSFLSKYESGDRRLDILELREVCRAIGISLEEFTKQLEKMLPKKRRCPEFEAKPSVKLCREFRRPIPRYLRRVENHPPSRFDVRLLTDAALFLAEN